MRLLVKPYKLQITKYNFGSDHKSTIYYTLKDRINYANNIGRIVFWTLIWPFSLLDNILSDLINALIELVKNKLAIPYESISKKALDSLDVPRGCDD